ncbi:MAG: DMT family transporter [Alphaproteobacteria bacterium]|jgi:drug/metabolite transporter (DMT)-like permease
MKDTPPWFGAVLAAAVALSFAGNTAAARIAFDYGTTPLTTNASRLAAAGILLFVVLKAIGVPTSLPPRTRLLAWALGPLMCLYQFALLSALEMIPLALAILIFYTFPIMTGIVSWTTGRESPTPAGIGAVLLAFAGLSLALDPGGGTIDPVGVLLAFLSAVGLTTMLQVNHRLVGSGDSRPVTLNMIASASLSAFVILAFEGGVSLPAGDTGWTAFAISALLFSFAVINMFVAMTMIGPVRMALTMNLEPIASMLLGVYLLGQPLTAIQVAGGALVIVAVLMVRLAPARTRHG